MKEENYDNLRRALDQLPDYSPIGPSWDAIERGLNKAPEPTPGAKALPSYSPPTSVWNQLNGVLDERATRRRRMRVVYRWAGRAAAILLIFSAGYGYATFNSGPKISYTYSEEAPSTGSLVSNDWNDEEDSFERVLRELSAINEPELNALRLELEELTAAKQEVEDMLRAYGHDNEVIKQLVEIESERSRVYRLAIAEL